MDHTIEQRMAELGIVLPQPQQAAGAYVPCLLNHGLLYISGQLPFENGVMRYQGKLGDTLSTEDGRQAARLATINALVHARAALGSLDHIAQCVKVTGYIAATHNFSGHAQVLNGASELLFEIFGEKGRHTRAAVGAVSLPLDAAVEIEFLFAAGNT